MAGNRQRQEAELADAGIGKRLPGFLSLSSPTQPVFKARGLQSDRLLTTLTICDFTCSAGILL